MPQFTFMTGATRYTLEAQDRSEALNIALEELSPDFNTCEVIMATMEEVQLKKPDLQDRLKKANMRIVK